MIRLSPSSRLSLALLLACLACNPNPASLSPTPLNTQPAESTQPPTPSNTPTQTLAPTPTPQSEFPAAAIEIGSPVAGSQLVSPLAINALLQPGLEGLVTVTLHAQDGRLLARHLVAMTPSDEKSWLQLELPFEIPIASQPARLSISTTDAYSRLAALSSVQLTLLAAGSEQTVIAQDSAEYADRIWIQSPQPLQIVVPGTLQISGLLLLSNAKPLLIQIMNRHGKVLDFAEIYIDETEGAYPSSFSTEFELNLDEAQWLQLGIFQRSSQMPGPMHFTSLEFFYSPY